MKKKRRPSSPRVTRRRVLQGLAATAAAAGCSSEIEQAIPPATTAASGAGGATAGAGGSPAVTSSTASTSGQGGQGGQGGQPVACDDSGNMSPQELLAPIDTIVVLMMENRSFDHYLGGSLALVEGRSDIEGLTGMEKNPASGGGDVTVFHMMNMTPEDPPHGWDAVHAQWNNGQNDGFVIEYGGPEVMGYYVRNQLPIHHAIADAHVVCNRWHCSVLGPTWPNRLYLHGASSNGQKSNQPVFGFESLWGPLKDAGLSVKNYHHGVAFCTGAYFKLDDLASFDAFKADAAAGNLPNFSIIDPQFFGTGANDDHPSNGDIPLAQLLISDVYTTLADSPQWSSCLLIVIYDEHGGFYDHVAPPTTADDHPDFQQMGIRIPGLVAGPYVRSGCAVNTVFDHASVAATLSARFGIQPLNSRHAAANDLSSCIDPGYVQSSTPQPPVQMPQLSMSRSQLRNRRVRHAQHPELVEALKQQGLWRRIARDLEPEATLARHLDHCARRGLVRLLP